MALKLYDVFRVKNENRFITHLLNPRVFPIDHLKLPRYSIYHYLDSKYDSYFPEAFSFLKDIKTSHKIFTEHVFELSSLEGKPKVINKNTKMTARKWMLENRKVFKNIDDINTAPLDIDTVRLVNYGLLNRSYLYVDNFMRNYNKWYNAEKTRIDKISSIIKNSTGKHFIEINIPTRMPSIPIFRMVSKTNDNKKIARVFREDEHWAMYHLFLFMSPVLRQQSIYSSLQNTDLSPITMIFKYKSHYSVVNLSLIDSHIEGSYKDYGFNNKTFNEEVMQRVFFKFISKVVGTVTEETFEKEGIKDPEDEDGDINNNDNIEHTSTANNDDSKDEDEDEKINNDTAYLNKLKEEKVTDKNGLLKNGGDEDDNAELVVDLTQTVSDTLGALTDDDDINESDIEFLKRIEDESEFEAVLDDSYFIKEETDNVELTYLTSDNHKEKTIDELDSLLKVGFISKVDYKKTVELVNTSKDKPSPYDKTKPIKDFIIITKEELELTQEDIQLPTTSSVFYKDSMEKSSLISYDKKYIDHVFAKDIIAAVYKVEDAGIIIKNYEIEEDVTILGEYELHRVTFKPVTGAESTVVFKLPKIDSDGNFTSAGVKVRMRKQKTDLPIRKLSHDRVALNSYYGKLFIKRTPRKQFSEVEFIYSHIEEAAFNGSFIKKVSIANVFDKSLDLPKIYTDLSMKFSRIEFIDFTLTFDYHNRDKLVNSPIVKKIESTGYVFTGITKKNNYIFVGKDNNFYSLKDETLVLIGSIYKVFNLPVEKAPVEYSELNLLTKPIPLGVMLSYYVGFKNLIKLLNITPKVIPSNKRYTLADNEWLIRTEDYKIVFSRSDYMSNLLLAGFNFYKDTLKTLKLEDLESKNVYLELLEQRGLGVIHLKELDMLRKLFLDPITIELLKDMNEPYEFIPLLIRANELLINNQHADMNDMSQMRVRGFERISGMLYKNLTTSVRTHYIKNTRGKSKIELSPFAVINSITSDQTLKLVEEINPITSLKETEAVTLTGSDGLSKDVISGKLRSYHKNDVGVTSESTVDSSDVGINTYLTSDPKFKNIRGVTLGEAETDPIKIVSTSALLSPSFNNDDPKRVNFINIQNSHTIATLGYHQPILRTGYEYITPYRSGKLFAAMAKNDGTVTSLTDKVITITYKDGTSEGVKIGQHYGNAEGSTYEHNIITDLTLNAKFKKGDPIAYNTGFFERDWLDPSKIIMKFSSTVRTALMEGSDTYEDSSAISKKVSEKLTTTKVFVKKYVLDFKSGLKELKPIGTEMKPNDIFFIIDDESLSSFGSDNTEISKSLQKLSTIAPRSKYKGKITKFEIRYNGDLEDMSSSLRKLSVSLDKDLDASTTNTESHIKTNRVSGDYRVDGKNLLPDTLEFRIYMTVPLKAEVGDKGVFGAQLKSVFGEVFDYELYTEEGQEIDATFSFISLMARVTLSPFVMGISNVVLKEMSKRIAAIYFNK